MGDSMSAIVLSGDTSGTITLDAPAVAGTTTLTLPTNTGTVVSTGSSAVVTPTMLSQPLTRGTAQAATSGTSIDFTGIPSWARRITVIFSGTSTNGNSAIIVQLGTASSIEITGYLGSGNYVGPTTGSGNSTVGLLASGGGTDASVITHGTMVINNITNNSWTAFYVAGQSDSSYGVIAGGSKTLSGTLTRLRITTAGGTNTFDAGTINIFYE
jgi:hypothetical protein